jgi:hypothetical protein
MSLAFEVTGPHTIQAKVANGSYSTIGRADNDDLFRIETEYQYHDVKTTEFGEMPADSIRTGAKAIITFSLVSIERSAIAAIINGIDGGSSVNYSYPKVGNRVKAGVAGGNWIGLKLVTSIAGARTVEVPTCRLLGVNHIDFGNRPSRVVIRAEAVPTTSSTGSAIATFTLVT